MKRNGAKGTSQPPAISINPIARYRLRYLAAAASVAGGDAVKVSDLYDILCIGSAAAAARRLCSAVRVRKIELWGAPVQSSTPTGNTVGIRDLTVAPLGGVNSLVEDTHLGADRPAHVLYIPKRGSMLYGWLDATSTSQVLALYASQGSVLDIELDVNFGFVANGAMPAVGAAITAVIGVMYFRKLDSNSGGNWAPPIGIDTA